MAAVLCRHGAVLRARVSGHGFLLPLGVASGFHFGRTASVGKRQWSAGFVAVDHQTDDSFELSAHLQTLPAVQIGFTATACGLL
jgi:hypothetical protein